jgi:hypothetical protein
MRRCVGNPSCALLAILGLTLTSQARSQSPATASQRLLPAWFEEWSALQPLGPPTRSPPSAAFGIPLLLLPPTRIGSFWSAGNPGAMVMDIRDRQSAIFVTQTVRNGSYRRPLDPGSLSGTQVDGVGWQPLESNGAVMGRVTFDRTRMDPSSVADVNAPYGSSPFVVTDTTSSSRQTDHARLESAGGWRVGAWGIGLAAGYDAQTTASIGAPFVRENRAVAEGVTIGAVRQQSRDGLQLTVRAGWQGGEETIDLSELTQEGAVFALEGYRDVPRQDLLGTYFRRSTREVRSLGIGLSGTAASTKWVTYGNVAHARDRFTQQQQDEPATDAWATSSVTAGGVLQRALLAERAMLTLDLRGTSTSGLSELTLPVRTGPFSSEQVLDANAELQIRSDSSPWIGVIRTSLRAEQRDLKDTSALLGSHIIAFTPVIAAELGRRVSAVSIISLAYAVAHYSGTGTIPSPASGSALFQRIFAPELDMATSVKIAQSASLSGQWRVTPLLVAFATASAEHLSSPNTDRAFAPAGARWIRTIIAGVTNRR